MWIFLLTKSPPYIAQSYPLLNILLRMLRDGVGLMQGEPIARDLTPGSKALWRKMKMEERSRIQGMIADVDLGIILLIHPVHLQNHKV